MPEDLTALLTKLKQLDEATWYEYKYGSLGEYEYDDENGSMSNDVDIDNLNEDGKAAWLQFCIQRACQARGWDWTTEKYHKMIFAKVTIPYECWTDDTFRASGDSPCHALLAAYIFALEGKT